VSTAAQEEPESAKAAAEPPPSALLERLAASTEPPPVRHPEAPGATEQSPAKAGPGRVSRAISTLLKLGVAFGLIAWLWKSGAIDFARVAAAARSPSWFVQVIALLFASISVITIRWWLLLRIEKIDLPLTDALKLTLVGHFWNNVLPGAVTGDVVKMYYLGKKSPEKKAEAYATVMIDRVIGLAALVYLAFFAALFNMSFVLAPDHEKLKLTFYGNALLVIGFTVAILALVLGIGRKSNLADRIRGSRLPGIEGFRRGYRTLIRLGERPWTLFASFALGMVSHVLLVVVGIISARTLGEGTLGNTTYGFLIPVGLLVNSIPIGLPGGLGAGEKAFQELFLWAGGGETLGAGIMLLMRIAQLTWGGVGGVLYVFDRKALAPREDAA
jgi:glycosyltransferase 2 family protein